MIRSIYNLVIKLPPTSLAWRMSIILSSFRTGGNVVKERIFYVIACVFKNLSSQSVSPFLLTFHQTLIISPDIFQ